MGECVGSDRLTKSHSTLDRLKSLMPLLRCVECFSTPLELQREIRVEWSNLKLDLAQMRLACSKCGSYYPVTSDFIPIMWTRMLKEFLLGGDENENAVAANSSVYDNISQTYLNYVRKHTADEVRVRTAANMVFDRTKVVLGQETPMHLDIGCGPGHMLSWLRGLGFRQVGLDPSLNNLRNARRMNDCLVVAGDATILPFRDRSFDLVTEGSALHHVPDWKAFVAEVCRCAKDNGGMIFDCEPTKEKMNFGFLAMLIWELRFPVYKILSYILKSKSGFRDMRRARLNARLAEYHHQPGKGFDIEEIRSVIESQGFSPEIVVSPRSDMKTGARPKWKQVIIRLSSFQNPWNSKYGNFTAVAVKKQLKSNPGQMQ